MTPYRRLIRRSIASGMAALAAAAVLSGTASLAAAAGLAASATVSVRPPTLAADGHDCGSGEWHFILNQINPPAAPPASITVYWANGSNQTVPRDTTPGSTKVAHYRTTSHLDSSVVNATAVIDTAWK
ncbi:MAG: hypothetical protein ACRDI2_12945, partial [Chloroflexota bacterium]